MSDNPVVHVYRRVDRINVSGVALYSEKRLEVGSYGCIQNYCHAVEQLHEMLWYDDVGGKGWSRVGVGVGVGVGGYIWATYNKLFECKFNDARLLK